MISPDVWQGGGVGACVVLLAATVRRFTSGRVQIDARVTSANTEAMQEQTRAVREQTKAQNRLIERISRMDERLRVTNETLKDLTTEVQAVKTGLSDVDKRVIRMEAAREANGHRN
jgi:septal ring factor EnvC (AmiA/AmiB activator)